MDLHVAWNLCITCQKNTTEPLNCPLQTKLDHMNESFLANVGPFQAIDALPTPIFFELDESGESFAMHNVSWHKSCYFKYHNSKLAKAKRRSARSENDPVRKCSKRQATTIDNCMFCENMQLYAPW